MFIPSKKTTKEMETSIVSKMPSRRKLIDIPDDVFRTLTVKAATMGLNLKNYIEQLLVREANEMDDADIYRYLVSTRPDGKVMLDAREKEDFEKWLESNRK